MIYILFGVVIIFIIFIALIVFAKKRKKRLCNDYDDNYFKVQNDWLVEQFRTRNVYVFGKKRTGKDLLFAHVIYLRGEKHYANMPYDDNTEVIELKEINVGGNTFEHIIEGQIEPFEPQFEFGRDIYLSDAGIFFPSQYHRILEQKFPDMPIFFALSGHLYELNVHCNCQELGRVWDKLREQADCYIRVLGCKWYRNYALVSCISYTDYNAAERKISPPSPKKSEKKLLEFYEKYGEVVYRTFKIYKSYLKYDTHYFRHKFFKNWSEEVLNAETR
ncbi:MAG TPA: hypothetical protein VIL26_06255 [Clostridia bacterium]